MLEKIGVGDIIIWLIVLLGIWVIYISIPHYWNKIKGIAIKNGAWLWIKKAILILSVYVVVLFLLDVIMETSRYYSTIPAGIVAIPATILIVFLYQKITKN